MNRKHRHTCGGNRSPTYHSWRKMKERCFDKAHQSYPRYGGRGIKVCNRWLIFSNFLEDMGERPAGCSIDRIDNNGDYTPENTRWATRKQQASNRSDSRLLTFEGETLPLFLWAERIGVNQITLGSRLLRGWSVEETLTRPVRGKKR